MHIRVIYQDDRHDIVTDFMLDRLIHEGTVKSFYRYSESRWIIIGRDPVRGSGGPYKGADRRRPPAKPLDRSF